MIPALALTALVAQPSIVVILSDDLGAADISNQTGIPTPNIDDLKARGVTFTHAYSVCPTCAPSRAGILTGQYPQRFGFYANYGDERGQDDPLHELYGVPSEVPMLQEYLHSQGYATGMFGKWHVGFADGKTPTDRGFDTFWGFLSHSNSYFPTDLPSEFPFYDGKTQTFLSEYQTTELADRASAWIRAQTGPYFCYVPFGAVHSPWEAQAATVSKFKTQFADWPVPSRRRRMAAMVTDMDKAIGTIVKAITDKGERGNTIVVFTSDNGGNGADGAASSNAPLLGWKWMLTDGGIRVPLVMSWPGHWTKGLTQTGLTSLMDISATVAPGFSADGTNLTAWLKQTRTDDPHSRLYFATEGYGTRIDERAMIQRRSDGNLWKWEESWSDPSGASWFSGWFNLSSDQSEQTNLVNADLGWKSLRTQWNAWRQTMEEPKW